ncbi:hypothetical protein HA050_01135 [Iodobacter sp. HSC-16F04]|uniref:Lipoprotein n=1 Tax=Iodobacter violaceini TaxID=3044271 RepID=A0ABX0KUQ2_9NEIS|nr:hypothetical protein [Iodobacter violacea]NHQ84721.1 hypothetical protein [Iodobacter violacea]
MEEFLFFKISKNTTKGFVLLFRYLTILLLLNSLIACSEKVPSSEKLDRASLMKLVFPSWKNQKEAQIQALALDEKKGEIPDSLVATAEGKEPSGYLFEISAEQLIRLNEHRAVLITSDSPVDQEGVSVSGHLSPGLMSAFWFKQANGRWYADGQQTQVDWVGAFGSIGKTKVVKLSQNQFALGVESGDCFQGACFTNLMLYELGYDKVKSILKHSISIAGDTLGARGDCEQIFKQAPNKVIRHHYAESEQSSFDCAAVKGDWQIKAGGKNPGDLLIRFSGFIEKQNTIEEIAAESDGDEATIVVDSTLLPVKQQQLFRYQQGEYRLISGKNPTPEF